MKFSDLPKLALQNPDLYGGDILESIEDLNVSIR